MLNMLEVVCKAIYCKVARRYHLQIEIVPLIITPIIIQSATVKQRPEYLPPFDHSNFMSFRFNIESCAVDPIEALIPPPHVIPGQLSLSRLPVNQQIFAAIARRKRSRKIAPEDIEE